MAFTWIRSGELFRIAAVSIALTGWVVSSARAESTQEDAAKTYLEVLVFDSDGVERHMSPWPIAGSGQKARSFRSISMQLAFSDGIFAQSTELMTGAFSDLASSYERDATWQSSGTGGKLTLARPSRFFSKLFLRSYYQGLVDQKGVPIPLEKRAPGRWNAYLTEPREAAGGWYPMREIDKGLSFAMPTTPGTKTNYGKIGTDSFAYRVVQVQNWEVKGAKPASPTKKLPEIKDVTTSYEPGSAKGWIVVFFQSKLATSLRAYAKANSLGISTVSSAGSNWGRHSLALHKLSVALESRYGQAVPIVPVGFSAGGITAWNSSNWFPEFIPGAVCDGHSDLGEMDGTDPNPWSMRSLPTARVALLSGTKDGNHWWAKGAHVAGLGRKQPRLFIEHPGGHTTAPLKDYTNAISFVLNLK